MLGLIAPASAGKKAAVLVVDLQADFTTTHQGSLTAEGTDQAYLNEVAQAAEELKKAGLPMYATQDWHPADHMSFAANHQGKKPFDTIELPQGNTQILWPVHCVQDSQGAEILLDQSLFAKIVKKGMDPKFDSYSGFKDDGGAETALDQTLKTAGINTIIIFGIASDYCVKATVMHGLEAGYKVVVIQNLCRGVAPDTSAKAWQDMEKAGAVLWPGLDIAGVQKL
jgi:nicotinamidase/pyrazinamidase